VDHLTRQTMPVQASDILLATATHRLSAQPKGFFHHVAAFEE
jgi:hypothetical protein